MKTQPIDQNIILREAIRLFRNEWPDYFYRMQADGLPIKIIPLYPNGITLLWTTFVIEREVLKCSLDEIGNYIKPAAINLAHRIPINSKFHNTFKTYEYFDKVIMSIEAEENPISQLEYKLLIAASPK